MFLRHRTCANVDKASNLMERTALTLTNVYPTLVTTMQSVTTPQEASLANAGLDTMETVLCARKVSVAMIHVPITKSVLRPTQ